jgi:hypothetical protein
MLFRKTLLDGCNWVSRPTEPLYDRPLTYDYLVALLASVRGRSAYQSVCCSIASTGPMSLRLASPGCNGFTGTWLTTPGTPQFSSA